MQCTNTNTRIHKNKYLHLHLGTRAYVTNVDAQIRIHKYTNRIASIEIWGPVPASATHADAQIHNINTQLKYTNSKVQIIRLHIAYLQIHSYVQWQIQIETIIQPSQRPQLAAPCIFLHHYGTRPYAFIMGCC